MGWFKPGSTGQSKLGGFSTFENILCYGKHPKRIYQDAISLSSVSNLNSDTLDHPCPKPLKLFTWLVDVASLDHAIVLDPFLGSGTTLVAAKLLGRRAIGIEIEEHYCEIAANRLRNTDLPLFEGLSPVLRQASFEAT
jgi:site-specific DNA-methyltransferase (adenine-specific)